MSQFKNFNWFPECTCALIAGLSSLGGKIPMVLEVKSQCISVAPI